MRTTCLSDKDERLLNSDKKQGSLEYTNDHGSSVNPAGITAQKFGSNNFVQAKTTKPSSMGCFSCFCLPTSSAKSQR